MIEAVIIDDELSGRETLQSLIRRNCPEIKIVDTCDSAKEGIKAINSYNPDLVFLDIEMPHQNGFEMLEHIGEVDFEVIFVTAYDKYAVRAFKYSALDYLLKPIVVPDLLKAVEKAMKKISSGKPDQNHLSTLFENLRSKNQQPVKIAIPDATGYVFIDLAGITRIEGDNRHSYIFQSNGPKITTLKSLKEFEELLSDDFCRVHKSHIVNMRFVKKYIKGIGGTLVMNDGMEIEVSRQKRTEVMKIMMIS